MLSTCCLSRPSRLLLRLWFFRAHVRSAAQEVRHLPPLTHTHTPPGSSAVCKLCRHVCESLPERLHLRDGADDMKLHVDMSKTTAGPFKCQHKREQLAAQLLPMTQADVCARWQRCQEVDWCYTHLTGTSNDEQWCPWNDKNTISNINAYISAELKL